MGENYEIYVVGLQGSLRRFNRGAGVDTVSVDTNLLTGPFATATVTTRMDGIDYYGLSTLSIQSSSDIWSVQGTSPGANGFKATGGVAVPHITHKPPANPLSH